MSFTSGSTTPREVARSRHPVFDRLAYTVQQKLGRAQRGLNAGHYRRAKNLLKGAKQLLWGAVEHAARTQIVLKPGIYNNLAQAFDLLQIATQRIPVRSSEFWQRYAETPHPGAGNCLRALTQRGAERAAYREGASISL